MESNGIAHALVCFALSTVSVSANASTYLFSQYGYSGGGTITGSFVAEDTNLDGLISSFNGEILDFSLSFSGDSIVGDFTHEYSDFTDLVYHLGTAFIGDDGDGLTAEGVASNWIGSEGFYFGSSLGPSTGVGGLVGDISSGFESSTSQLISVTAIPVPAAIWLFGSGFLGLIGIARSTKTA